MIIENGTIRTMDDALPVVRALAVAGDRVAGGVGTTELALPSPERVDLGGRCVLPGFTDAHVHFPSWAIARRHVCLEGCGSLEEALERVRAHAETTDASWVIGRGWRSGDWPPGTEPTRAHLDRAVAERPVALTSRDGHSLWLNSSALAAAAGDLDTDGGVVERDAAGAPTGVLRERSAWRFQDRFARPGEAETRSAMREAIRVANERGVVAVHDKDGGRNALEHWQALAEHGALSLRVWQSLPIDRLDALSALGIAAGFGDGLLRIGYLKAFMDGSLGSGTAWRLDGTGVQLLDQASLARLIRQAAEAGFSVAVHAIGDRANREALDAFADTRNAWQTRGMRPRIEHVQLVAAGDLHRFAELGVACSIQFSHAPADRHVAEAAWPGLDGAYAYRSLLESGAMLVNGSDAPVEDLDPLQGLRAAVARTLDEQPGWRLDQAVSVEAALRASIVTAPWLEHAERERGRLVPGMLADLVVLDHDPLCVSPDELSDLSIVATMVGGRWVHNPPPWD